MKVSGSEIKKIYINDASYLDMLRSIKDSPEILYFMGDISIASQRAVAVIGTRKATSYGIDVAYRLGQKLAENGIVAVSGLARGIDSSGHKGALAGGGKTIAVMGCGIDICFPSTNVPLWREIISKGLVLSEYPPGMPGGKFTFPKRNRIISGLSEATVVVESGIKGGALITAELAAEQGRDVYAVPGNIDRVASFGANKLIRDGAMPLVILDDIMEDLGVTPRQSEKVKACLGGAEKRIYDMLLQNGEMTLEDVCVKLDLKPQSANGLITVLEMKGYIQAAMGKVFIARSIK